MRLLTFRDPGDGRPMLGMRCRAARARPRRRGTHRRPRAAAEQPQGTARRRPERDGAGARAEHAAQAHDGRRFDAAWRDEATLEYLPPIGNADKFLCVGKNYRQHLEELQRTNLIKEIPQEPTAFVKLNSSLVGHRARSRGRPGIVRLDYEPELVFVIGRRALGVKKAEAFNYVAGVTILNDLTDRDSQEREVKIRLAVLDRQEHSRLRPARPRAGDPRRDRDPYDLWMTCSVNGELRMRVNTRDQIWKLPDILEHFSRHIPIEPGDMFSTGAPGGVAVGKPNAAELFLKPGDVVECASRATRRCARPSSSRDVRARLRGIALPMPSLLLFHRP